MQEGYKKGYMWLQKLQRKSCNQNRKSQAEKSKKRVNEIMVKSIEQDDELTEKQRLFCMYWVKNKNATISAIKAGYAPDSAHVRGSELLRNPKVRAQGEQ